MNLVNISGQHRPGRDTAMTFYFFASRLFENDFRVPLIRALIAKGHEVLHVRIGRVNVLTGPNGERTEFKGAVGFLKLIAYIHTHSKARKSLRIFFDSTGAVVPIRSLLLRVFFRGLWCFDIFDDLSYELRGLSRLKRRLGVFLLTWLSPIKLVRSRQMFRIVPGAYYFDNAAHTRRIDRSAGDFGDIVTLFSIDNRFDFALIREIATSAPELKIYLYGRIVEDDPTTKRRLEELRANSPNVVYRGEYRLDDADSILAPFGIGLAPYVMNNRLTRFISPDKYHLYLNSGMEVISTDIPHARDMNERIHVARSAKDIIQLAARIRSDPSFRKNSNPNNDLSWDARADDLVEIIRSRTALRRHEPSNRSRQHVGV